MLRGLEMETERRAVSNMPTPAELREIEAMPFRRGDAVRYRGDAWRVIGFAPMRGMLLLSGRHGARAARAEEVEPL